MNRASAICGTITKDLVFMSLAFEREKETEAEKYSKQ